MENKPIVVNFDGEQERDFIHVEDVAKSMILLLRESFAPGIYEIGTGKSTKIIDLAKLIILLSGKKSKIVFKKPNIEEIRISRAKRPFLKEYKPLEEGIKEILEMYKILKL